MAGASPSSSNGLLTEINVTPLVDVVLVLLVIMIVTANAIASKTIPVDLPKSRTGEPTQGVLAISIDADGKLFLDAQPVDEAGLQARAHAAHAADPENARAVLAADGSARHERVVRVIDLLRREQVTKFAINVSPELGSP
jgi:biopolymer transport protein ExbD